MKKIFSVLIVALLACGSASARPRHWYTDWRVWAGVGVIGGTMFADARSTCLGFAQGGVEAGNFRPGSNSCAATSATLAAVGVGYAALHVLAASKLRDDPNAAIRFLSLVSVPAVVFAGHGSAAIENYENLRGYNPNASPNGMARGIRGPHIPGIPIRSVASCLAVGDCL